MVSMSLTETKTNPPVNQIIKNDTGITEAVLSLKTLSVQKQSDGTTTIFVCHENTEILFVLTQDEASHLANLLSM